MQLIPFMKKLQRESGPIWLITSSTFTRIDFPTTRMPNTFFIFVIIILTRFFSVAFIRRLLWTLKNIWIFIITYLFTNSSLLLVSFLGNSLSSFWLFQGSSLQRKKKGLLWIQAKKMAWIHRRPFFFWWLQMVMSGSHCLIVHKNQYPHHYWDQKYYSEFWRHLQQASEH